MRTGSAVGRHPLAGRIRTVPARAVSAHRYDPGHTSTRGNTMRHTATTILLATVLGLTATACGSSGGDGKPAAKKPAATKTVTATPSLSQEETARLCSVAVSEAAPGWDDWNFSPGGWQDDPRTPDICHGLADAENPPRGNREFMAALLDGLEMADDPRAGQ